MDEEPREERGERGEGKTVKVAPLEATLPNILLKLRKAGCIP